MGSRQAHRSVMLGALVGLQVGARTSVAATVCATDTQGEHTLLSGGLADVHEAALGDGLWAVQTHTRPADRPGRRCQARATRDAPRAQRV